MHPGMQQIYEMAFGVAKRLLFLAQWRFNAVRNSGKGFRETVGRSPPQWSFSCLIYRVDGKMLRIPSRDGCGKSHLQRGMNPARKWHLCSTHECNRLFNGLPQGILARPQRG